MASSSSGSPPWTAPTAVVVDDSPSARAFFRRVLAHHGVTVVAEADAGDEVLGLYQAHRPDLLVVDVVLPRLSGIEAAVEVLTLDPGALVVACSEFAVRDHVLACRRAGVAHFWLKPVEPATIAQFLRTRVRPRGGLWRAA